MDTIVFQDEIDTTVIGLHGELSDGGLLRHEGCVSICLRETTCLIIHYRDGLNDNQDLIIPCSILDLAISTREIKRV